jgi:hypothetical protein
MSPVRRTISLVGALALTGAGLYLAVLLLFFTDGFAVLMLLGACAMLGLGLYWLWEDFIRPNRAPTD